MYVPFDQEFSPRTNEGFAACAFSASSTGIPDYGIKGTAFLQNFVGLSIIDCNIFDYMHSVCLGIFKSLVNLLFLSNTSPFSLKSSISTHERTLRVIKFPSSIVKAPPLLSNHSMWQAKDYRNFFLLCFLLLNFAESQIIQGIMQLRKGIIFLLDNVSVEKSQDAKQCFFDFMDAFSSTFGEHFATTNYHGLHHLPDMALRCNSLADFSGFNFEHINGELSRLCKGNKRFDMQICRKISALSHNNFPNISDESSKASFIRKLFSQKRWKATHFISDQIFICGKLSQVSNMSEMPGFESNDVTSRYFEGKKALVKNKKVSTSQYDANKKFSNSFYLSLDHQSGIEIQKIILKRSALSSSCFMIFKKFEMTSNIL